MCYETERLAARLEWRISQLTLAGAVGVADG